MSCLEEIMSKHFKRESTSDACRFHRRNIVSFQCICTQASFVFSAKDNLALSDWPHQDIEGGARKHRSNIYSYVYRLFQNPLVVQVRPAARHKKSKSWWTQRAVSSLRPLLIEFVKCWIGQRTHTPKIIHSLESNLCLSSIDYVLK